LLALLIALNASCRPQEIVVELPVTAAAPTAAPPQVVTKEVTRERIVQVTEQETVQVVVTSTPTPIPEGGTLYRATYQDAQTANPIAAADPGSQTLTRLVVDGRVANADAFAL
jgi:hypothetical protein